MNWRAVWKDSAIAAAILACFLAIWGASYSYGTAQEKLKNTLDNHEQRLEKVEELPQKVDRIGQNVEDIKDYFAIPTKRPRQ